jgi:hypothetical protein
MTDPIIIGSEIKYVVDADTRIVCLTTNVSTGAGILSYEENQVKYQIPALKKFIPMRIFLENSETTTNSSLELYFGPTVDTTTGATIFAKFRTSGTGGGINFEMGGPDIATGQFVSLRNNSAGNIYSTMIGVETNA